MIPDLESLVQIGGDHAKQVLIGKPRAELLTTYLLYRNGANGDLEIEAMVCPWRDELEKIAIIETVRAHAHAIGAEALSVISEAWVSVYPLGGLAGRDPPSQRPDRVEIVFAVATDGDTVKAGRWNIRRKNPGGPVTALVREDVGDGKFQGRLIEGILPKRKVRT